LMNKKMIARSFSVIGKQFSVLSSQKTNPLTFGLRTGN